MPITTGHHGHVPACAANLSLLHRRPTGYGLPTATSSAGRAGAEVIDRRESGCDAPGVSCKRHSPRGPPVSLPFGWSVASFHAASLLGDEKEGGSACHRVGDRFESGFRSGSMARARRRSLTPCARPRLWAPMRCLTGTISLALETLMCRALSVGRCWPRRRPARRVSRLVRWSTASATATWIWSPTWRVPSIM